MFRKYSGSVKLTLSCLSASFTFSFEYLASVGTTWFGIILKYFFRSGSGERQISYTTPDLHMHHTIVEPGYGSAFHGGANFEMPLFNEAYMFDLHISTFEDEIPLTWFRDGAKLLMCKCFSNTDSTAPSDAE